MSLEGRITGRMSPDGSAYELVQYGMVRQSIPIRQAHEDEKLKRAIDRNGWEELT